MLDPLSLSIDLTPAIPSSGVILPTRRLLRRSLDHPDDYIMELDYSSASKVIECARAAENYLIHSREAATDSSATSFGKLFHSCEELRLRNGWSEAVKQRQHELVAQHFITHQVAAGDYRNSSQMLLVLQKYNAMYSTPDALQRDDWPNKTHPLIDDAGLPYPFVERSFKVPLCTIPVHDTIKYFPTSLIIDCDPILSLNDSFYARNIHVFFTGRIDAVISDSNLTWVVDHKTSSRGGREFEEAFRLSLQTRGYTWAAQKLLGIPVAGLIMNAVVIRPPTKIGTNIELHRRPYFYSPDSLDEFEDSMKHIVSNFASMLVSGYFPQCGRSFKSPCAGCSYQENCSLPRTQRHADLSSDLFRDVTWNPVTE